ncbi:MAG: GntR family transcriptional regulator, partial [Akkermansiaceae bacterium]|nr:GntR family transcriptional regulator [Akkermansiaceae bacterium]
MSAWRLLSAAEQVAAHLAKELAAGRWSGQMAGVYTLACELGVSRNTIEAALRQLEKEGLLVPQGAGRRRQIPKSVGGPQAHPLRVALLVSEPADRRPDYVVDLQHRLAEAGHEVFHTAKTLSDLGMDVRRVARLVRETNADAWVVNAASREVLEWFAAQPLPVFALFGRRGQLPIAGIGPDKLPALAEATRTLIGLGHRRIVLLTRRRRRLPVPGALERGFLKELSEAGIPTGDYNLPDWVESVEGFHTRLHSLFRVTPPTALVLDEPPFVTATLQFCCSQ